MDDDEQDLTHTFVARQKWLAAIGWATAACLLLGSGVLYATVADRPFILWAGIAAAGFAAAGARGASRRARLIAQGEDASDLDLDF